jgi:hypothetical protein
MVMHNAQKVAHEGRKAGRAGKQDRQRRLAEKASRWKQAGKEAGRQGDR